MTFFFFKHRSSPEAKLPAYVMTIWRGRWEEQYTDTQVSCSCELELYRVQPKKKNWLPPYPKKPNIHGYFEPLTVILIYNINKQNVNPYCFSPHDIPVRKHDNSVVSENRIQVLDLNLNFVFKHLIKLSNSKLTTRAQQELCMLLKSPLPQGQRHPYYQ